jgi:integrase/recombinase XerD
MDIAEFETDTLAGFVLARASAGLADATIPGDVGHLEQVRTWFGRPLWEMQPADADAYFGRVLRETAKGTRLSRAQALKTYLLFLELRHKVEIHNLTGHVLECPIDELNRPRGRCRGDAAHPADHRGGRRVVRRVAPGVGDVP